MNCRHCNTELKHIFIDLGFAPPSNAYLSVNELNSSETYYPLKLYVCEKCWLVQTIDYTKAEDLFSKDYAYFSSVSKSWLNHAHQYVNMISERLELNTESFVIEIAANDGYLLRNFVAKNIPCLGIEPTESTALIAKKHGIPILQEFFGESLGKQLATEDKKADLIIGNNVFAHVPNINDFTKGLKAALKQNGTITLEFPHLMRLIENIQFDTVYHEHFSYLSLYSVNQIFQHAGLRIWHVEELPTHGGSIRVYGCHAEDSKQTTKNVQLLLEEETRKGLLNLETYYKFQQKAEKIKNDLLSFLIEKKQQNKTVVAYGAAAKGNTLLNFAGVKSDLIPYIYDAAESKQGKFMPGSHIAILHPETILEHNPDYVLILPWNIADEIKNEIKILTTQNISFVTAIPNINIL